MVFVPGFEPTSWLRPNTQESNLAHLNNGRSGGVRTHDLCVPNAALYQAELHSDCARLCTADAQKSSSLLILKIRE